MAGIVDRAHEIADLVGNAGPQFEHGIDGGMHLDHQLLEFRRALDDIGPAGEAEAQVRGRLSSFDQFGTHQPAHHHAGRAGGQRAELLDPGHHANPKELISDRRISRRIGPARSQQHLAPLARGRLSRCCPQLIEGQTDHGIGKDHCPLERNQRQRLWCLFARLVVQRLVTHSASPNW